ncbi:hypothetical protein HXX76_010558 [Chlamydomonas incerta]|uniref:EamA domain-containing protein n=1 Tax=Chlamydomonas incerta TaxID=51695 RepID=A0A835SML0_CHLIN|nr:hypothetical protein HXX76_010558 [Chlamydomonas incerta]|eukprot:KAG2429774.1 hypothetical protein HXX76_010558 [Chlamydomonas incerta]
MPRQAHLMVAQQGWAATSQDRCGSGGNALKWGADQGEGDDKQEAAEAEGDGTDGGGVALSTIFKAAMLVAPVWFAAQLTFTASLEFTSVTSNTVLSSCSSLFVYLGALALRQERGSGLRLAGVVAAMAGTTLVTLADRRSGGGGGESGGGGGGGTGGGSAPLLGDGLTLLAAALYAAYTLIMRKMLVKDDAVVTALFFGAIGAACTALLLPLAAALAAAGSPVVTRVTAQALGLALVQGLVDYVAADYAWARAVMLLGPTATSCGLALQIPAAAVIDALANGNKLAWTETPARLAQFLAGSGLIIAGFMGVSVEPRAAAAWLQRWRARRGGGGGGGGGGSGHSSGGGGGEGRGHGLRGGYEQQAGWRDAAAAPGGGGQERTRLLRAAAETGPAGGGASSGADAGEAADEAAAAAAGDGLGNRSRGGSGALEAGTGSVAGRALRAVGQALGRGGAAAAMAAGGGGGGDGATAASYIPLTDKSFEGK